MRLWPAVTALHISNTGLDGELSLLVYGIVVCFYWHALLTALANAVRCFRQASEYRPSFEGGQKMRAWRLGANCLTKILAPGVSKFCRIRNLVDAMRAIWSKFCTEDMWISGATVEHLVVGDLCIPDVRRL